MRTKYLVNNLSGQTINGQAIDPKYKVFTALLTQSGGDGPTTNIGDETFYKGITYLIVDLPPGTGDIQITLCSTVPITGAVIVSTPQQVALADARKGIALFKLPALNVPILGIVENMAYFTPEELPENKYYIFGKDGAKNLAEEMQIPLLGQIPLVQSIRESGDVGRPAVMQETTPQALAFREMAQNVAQQVAILNANKKQEAVA